MCDYLSRFIDPVHLRLQLAKKDPPCKVLPVIIIITIVIIKIWKVEEEEKENLEILDAESYNRNVRERN